MFVCFDLGRVIELYFRILWCFNKLIKLRASLFTFSLPNSILRSSLMLPVMFFHQSLYWCLLTIFLGSPRIYSCVLVDRYPLEVINDARNNNWQYYREDRYWNEDVNHVHSNIILLIIFFLLFILSSFLGFVSSFVSIKFMIIVIRYLPKLIWIVGRLQPLGAIKLWALVHFLLYLRV